MLAEGTSVLLRYKVEEEKLSEESEAAHTEIAFVSA